MLHYLPITLSQITVGLVFKNNTNVFVYIYRSGKYSIAQERKYNTASRHRPKYSEEGEEKEEVEKTEKKLVNAIVPY